MAENTLRQSETCASWDWGTWGCRRPRCWRLTAWTCSESTSTRSESMPSTRGTSPISEPGLARSAVAVAVASGKLRAGYQPEAADAFIVAVPTPIDSGHSPDLSALHGALESLAPQLRAGDSGCRRVHLAGRLHRGRERPPGRAPHRPVVPSRPGRRQRRSRGLLPGAACCRATPSPSWSRMTG